MEVSCQRFSQSGHARHRTVSILASVNCGFKGFSDRDCGMKIRLPQLEMNNRATLTFQFSRARIDRERALAAHHGHARGQRSHSDGPPDLATGAGVTGIWSASTKRGKNSKTDAAAMSSTISGSVNSVFNWTKKSSVMSCAE